ncbi:LysR family transcriptional regulator [Reinekea thalattae]|uniref:LysR family transcriptional regulator n=1 Tax=Reinekea thalattae TaxID=2593301 RepID=A0A5C8Z394_9GAMM|nr:LysR family transcriptional regulator [Reinekea thalattae]TXR51400.1 LysR family transcriptional regulator [Reinekea thalattae]
MNRSTHKPSMRQLQLLKALVETQSISKVAEQEFISQPSVSIQLKKLAQLVGTPLYRIEGRQVQITEAGQVLYRCAQEIDANIDNMFSELAALQGLQAGTLRLAVVSTAQYFMPIVLGPFYQRYPNIDVQLTIANRETVISRLQQNKDDFYLFSHCPEDLDIVKEPFMDNSLIVIAPEQHALTQQSKIGLTDLQQHPFVMRESGSGTRRSIQLFCQQHDIHLAERMTIETNEAIKHAVASGLGLAILSRHTLDYTNISGFVRLDVEHFPIVSEWYLVHARKRALSTLAKTFHDYMQQEGKQLLMRLAK